MVLLAYSMVASKDVNSTLVASVDSVKAVSLMTSVLLTLVLAPVASLALGSAVLAVPVAVAVSLVLLEALVALVL